MKKLIALFLILTLALSFAACGKEETVEDITTEEVVEETVEQTEEETVKVEDLTGDVDFGDLLGGDVVVELPIATPDGYILDGETGDLIDPATGEIVGNEFEEYEEETPVETVPSEATQTLQVLQNIWAAYGEDEKFAIMGGNPEAGLMDAPGVYDMAYAENLGFQLVIPAEQMSNVTEAATMIHMMNANNFTCGVVKLADGADAAAFAQAVRDAIQGNQWICGFPETLIIADMGGSVLISFGVNDAMTPFMANLTEAYADAQVLFNEAIAG